ncbi:SDR family oxidoreductase [Bosea sp. CS1GBMeth4]|uniref:SDR family oxidoreductase n=1 Tax=Bosea sp. CS1GBMeth4 TaxID=1892849 RepID=UPI001FCE8E96|nr:SDR family oxidoreductase [Bosea sp. CS1GBMeth4]
MSGAMLQGRHALVTGSVAGLGYAMARGLALQGAAVTLNGLAAPGVGEAAAAALAAEAGVPVVFDGTDLAQPPQIEAMMAAAERRSGPVDILVNNAVIRHFRPIESFTAAQWDASLAVNLSAAFHAVRLALPGMKAKGWGRIVNLSSIYGARGAENRIDYVTTKTALLGMTRAIAIETARTGITCNALAPGTVPSPAILERIAGIARAQGISEEKAAQDYIAPRHPTERFVALESVAAMLVFLCSSAGQDITGATLPIDGGWQAR